MLGCLEMESFSQFLLRLTLSLLHFLPVSKSWLIAIPRRVPLRRWKIMTDRGEVKERRKKTQNFFRLPNQIIKAPKKTSLILMKMGPFSRACKRCKCCRNLKWFPIPQLFEILSFPIYLRTLAQEPLNSTDVH